MPGTSRDTCRSGNELIAWAVEQGLVVVVEEGASADHLSSSQGRTPTYARMR